LTVVNLDPYRAESPPHLMRTLVLLHRVIAANEAMAARFPSRATAARRRVARARADLTRAQVALANQLLA
jgi:hypothetical protein